MPQIYIIRRALFASTSRMKNIAFIIAASLFFTIGCQSVQTARWLTPPKGHQPQQVLGQAPLDDPFPMAQNPTVQHPAAQHPAAQYPPPVFASSHDPFAPILQHTINTDVAAEETERQRIKMLATTARDGAPDYLQPFNHWDGPFANRSREKTLEQDIIRQVGFEPVSERIFSNEPLQDWEKDPPKKGFDWSSLNPAKSFSKARDWAGLGPDENKANESMKKGREIIAANPDLKDKKKNLEAAKLFVEAGKKFPDSVLEEDALHLAGECYFLADDYYNAFMMYQKLVMRYQHSKHMDNGVRRLFKIGRYWELESEKRGGFNLTDKSLPGYDFFGFAKKAYETIFMNDPNGPVSDDALMALATAYLKKGRYQGDDNFNQAAFYYQQLREEYPLSKHFAKACENELYARTQAYLGPEHPSRTLDEARKLTEITLRQFGGELGYEGRNNILEIKESILEKEAEQLWERGQFWDLKKRRYGSARLYYERLMEEYPQTAFAEKALRRMEQIKGLPDAPSIIALPINPFKAEE
jgi:tetratricopeptide (TPR) repeat protein